MSHEYIEFFAADDDTVAAAVLPTGPGRAFRTVSGTHFFADDAIATWEDLLIDQAGTREATVTRPRTVVSGGNDGSAVFALSDKLINALALAEPARRHAVAEVWWAEVLRDDESVDRDTAHQVVAGVADLARDAVQSGHRVYCWVS